MKPLQHGTPECKEKSPSAFQSKHSLHTGAIPTAHSIEGSTATRSRGTGPKLLILSCSDQPIRQRVLLNLPELSSLLELKLLRAWICLWRSWRHTGVLSHPFVLFTIQIPWKYLKHAGESPSAKLIFLLRSFSLHFRYIWKLTHFKILGQKCCYTGTIKGNKHEAALCCRFKVMLSV